MNEILINIDTVNDYHPFKVVIAEDGKKLVDMPSDEFSQWLKRLMLLGSELH